MTTAIIFPSLQHLNCNSSKLDISQEEGGGMGMIVRKKLDDKRKIAEGDLEREIGRITATRLIQKSWLGSDIALAVSSFDCFPF